MSKIFLLFTFVAMLVAPSFGSSVNERLSSKILNPAAKPKPCAKPADPTPPPKKQFLDQRLPVVVNDYHAPKGGFNPSHIDDKEVDRAARRILREIQKQEADDKENNLPSDNPVVEMTTEEHVAFKQLLLDSDILVNAVKKLASENGPIEAAKVTGPKVAIAAVKAAAKLEKKANHPKPAAKKTRR